MEKFDLIIIGGGRSLNIAKSAAKMGKKVALIEKSKFGGTCPNRGCIPSKLLIGHAHVARSIKESERHFISAEIKNIDTKKIFETNSKFVNFIGNYVEENLPDTITVFKGEAAFIADKEIRVNDTTLTADTIVIATGARPRKILHEKAWSSDHLFPLNEAIPKSVTIVGAGFIGVELANFFEAIGIKTVLISNNSKILPREDAEISAIFKEEFTKQVEVIFDTNVKKVDYNGNTFTLELETLDGEKSVHETEVLIEAIGRIPNSEALHLENTAIKVNKYGYVERNEFCETHVKGVYAVGDIASKYALQHISSFEMNYLIEHLFGNSKAPLSYKYVPHAVFSDPEIAAVGITEEEAKAQNLNYVVSTTNWSNSAKARSTRLDYPRTKFIVNPETFEILGCHLIGPESSTMIHQILAVMHIDNDIRHLGKMMYIHPALNEVIAAGANDILNKIANK